MSFVLLHSFLRSFSSSSKSFFTSTFLHCPEVAEVDEVAEVAEAREAAGMTEAVEAEAEDVFNTRAASSDPAPPPRY